MNQVVTSVEQALAIVRLTYPTARAEGSTFDWSFWVDDTVVAEMKTNRRSRKREWRLTIRKQAEVDRDAAETAMFRRIAGKK